MGVGIARNWHFGVSSEASPWGPDGRRVESAGRYTSPLCFQYSASVFQLQRFLRIFEAELLRAGVGRQYEVDFVSPSLDINRAIPVREMNKLLAQAIECGGSVDVHVKAAIRVHH